MCGICGIISEDQSVNKSLLESMASQLTHRGPDSEGYFINGAQTVGLGFRRLSIIDIDGGAQPIFNEIESIAVVFNGEIYNFRELRKDLIRAGHIFRTNTDTEVIVHAYEEYGIECVHRFRGMFAFALWDRENERLFAARDRVGKKPFFYFHKEGRFVFGSELKALFPASVPKRISAEGLWLYLKYQYIAAPWSIIDGIKKLSPAHCLVFDAKSGSLNTYKYWEPVYEPKTWFSVDDAKSCLLDIIREAVRLRMISDVPLGALLSGGIDSSLITALMAEQSGKPIKTFTIGFSEASHDERSLARELSDRYATEHFEFVVTPDATEILPDLVWGLDEPMADSSALPSYYIAKMAREHVTVVLNGDGGDEVFAGYNHLASLLRMSAFARIPKIFRGTLAIPIAQALHKTLGTSQTQRLSNLAVQSNWSAARRYEAKMILIQDPSLLMLDPPKDVTALEFIAQSYMDAGAEIDAILHSDLTKTLPGDLLVKMDRMTMINSLEARSPLLDHHLIDFANRLPVELKVNHGQRKYILREIARDYLPKNHFEARKSGFSIPLKKWVDENSLPVQNLYDESGAIYDVLSFDAVRTSILENTKDPRRHHQIWALLILETWLAHVIKA
jgi:asparagine synthase (glutamine-hydrolysing)